MTRLSAAFWIGLALASGFTTFKVKHAVQDIDDQLTRARKHAVAEQQEIRVLAAEWTYLNQPDRLMELNRAFLHLGTITPRQLQQRLEDLPWRAPATAPDVLLAASSAAAMPHATAGAPAVARAGLDAVVAASAAPVRLAKATTGSLDALIAQVADTR